VQLRWISATGVSEHPIDAAAELLARSDGLVWLDIPSWDAAGEQVLRDVFAFHPLAIRDCAQRNQVPKVHVYPDNVFLVLHSPHAGAAGHVHTIELDQFIGDRYLVTVHGPLSATADPAAARIEVDALARRLESGKLRPRHAYDLTYAIASTVAKRQRDFTARLTADMWDLEYRFQAVVKEGPSGHLRDPEQFLDELFSARHGFSMVRTQAATSRGIRPHVQDQGVRRGPRTEEDRRRHHPAGHGGLVDSRHERHRQRPDPMVGAGGRGGGDGGHVGAAADLGEATRLAVVIIEKGASSMSPPGPLTDSPAAATLG
jgi:CorA-like Mg2+ transporter protein